MVMPSLCPNPHAHEDTCGSGSPPLCRRHRGCKLTRRPASRPLTELALRDCGHCPPSLLPGIGRRETAGSDHLPVGAFGDRRRQQPRHPHLCPAHRFVGTCIGAARCSCASLEAGTCTCAYYMCERSCLRCSLLRCSAVAVAAASFPLRLLAWRRISHRRVGVRVVAAHSSSWSCCNASRS